MRYHPAVLMIAVWTVCIAAFYALPLQLENRTLSLIGFLVLALFIGAFCAGTLLAGRSERGRASMGPLIVSFRNADRVLIIACTTALAALAWDSLGRNLFDLGASFQQRDMAAGALMGGAASSSSLMFQIGFLTYPAAYILLAREIAFKPQPNFLFLGVFGLGPIMAASLVMGGRFPLLYALTTAVLAYRLRRFTGVKRADPRPRPEKAASGARQRAPLAKIGFGTKVIVATAGCMIFVYSAQVFLTRASFLGGVEQHLAYASTSWGVNFNGRFSEIFISGLGVEGAYLVFVFTWYTVQGFVMSNVIFTDYQGPMLFGTYGIDLASALMRRLNGDYVGDSFFELLRINTYGFLPSAFGTLFVDLKYIGILISGLWGWGAGIVFLRARNANDPRWLLVLPFVTMGIVFSLLNTPFGFANGFSTHLWLLATFLLIKVRPQNSASPAASAGRRRSLGRPPARMK